MPISNEDIRSAIIAISDVSGVWMDTGALAEDAILLAYAFPEEDEFKAACANTCRALSLLVEGKVATSDLKYAFEDWQSYHYQHHVGQGSAATCRIIYRKIEGGIEVMGFGHRHIPEDFYVRMSKCRDES